jgi:bifunctional NMN adenylyltransferase/nudix hydrolase
MTQFDTVVAIGRFQPPHRSHLALIEQANRHAKQQIIICIGSSNQPRTVKNPFSFQERADLIRASVAPVVAEKLRFVPLEDNIYNDQIWVAAAQQAVAKITSSPSVGIIGHIKDDSSYYLKMFPQWSFIDFGYLNSLHATEIRELYFKPDSSLDYLSGVVPSAVLDFLRQFKTTAHYQQICREKEFITKYKQQFAMLPYSPVFVTTDAVVIQSGHVLLIKRRAEPGKGLLAFPGGFLEAKTDKSLEDCMMRELQEETGIKVPEKVLRGNIKTSKVFDAVDRSARGRTITHAYKIVLGEDGASLPKLRAASDAAKAEWHPLGTLKRDMFFEDHWDILQYFIGTNAY